MEEIDIIELLKRVKEGKAPKEIEINNHIYEFDKSEPEITLMYKNKEGAIWVVIERIYFNTKIKILDKPIIEELGGEEYMIDCSNPVKLARGLENIQDKINEIIRVINNKENKDE